MTSWEQSLNTEGDAIYSLLLLKNRDQVQSTSNSKVYVTKHLYTLGKGQILRCNVMYMDITILKDYCT